MSMPRRAALVVLALLLAGAGLLLGLELAAGARDYGTSASRPPCAPHPAYPGDGLDATLQRIVLDGLSGAACELGATREELVLSLAPSTVRPKDIRWDDATIQRAVRSGLVRAIDDAEDRGSLPGPVATVLRAAAERAPVAFLVERGTSSGPRAGPGAKAGIRASDAGAGRRPQDVGRTAGTSDPGGGGLRLGAAARWSPGCAATRSTAA